MLTLSYSYLILLPVITWIQMNNEYFIHVREKEKERAKLLLAVRRHTLFWRRGMR